ncbi:MAG: hypothetical protein ABFS37_01210 [Acidobacteriota bacterium]
MSNRVAVGSRHGVENAMSGAPRRRGALVIFGITAGRFLGRPVTDHPFGLRTCEKKSVPFSG